jgi:pyocin large subunit-like protein
MTSAIKDFYAGAVLATLLALASCDRGAETQEAPAQTAVTTSLPSDPSPDGAENASDENDKGGNGGSRRASASGDDPRDQPIPVHDDGAPIWSANSRNTAQENAERSFKRNGEDFGAKNVDQYVDMAHAFIGDPPKGTLRLTRNNGDKLFYDPKGNVFAVATREGAPRTMFKPDEGMSYWKQQEQQIARRSSGDRG